jgi:ABC-2 type transport system permease protein
MTNPISAIVHRDLQAAFRDRFLLIATLALTVAAVVSLVTGAIALHGDVATYDAARAQLLALGKSVDAIAAPEFYPLKLLRGTIEQIEIMGAVIALVAGYRAAASERGNQTLALVFTRPIRRWQILVAKVLGGVVLSALSLAAVFGIATLVLAALSGVGLTFDDVTRIIFTWGTSTLYVSSIFVIGFALSLWMKSVISGLIAAFAIWMSIVLVAPQIGDTMDPDNQVAGGVFAALSVPKAEQDRIKGGFATYETIRNGIEVSSVTKHFERLSFAVLGIKDTYTGKPFADVLNEKRGDLIFLILFTLGLGAIAVVRPVDPDKLIKET